MRAAPWVQGELEDILLDWIGLSSVLRPLQHSIGYMDIPLVLVC